MLAKPSKFVTPERSDGTSDGIKTLFVDFAMHFVLTLNICQMDLFFFFPDSTPMTSHSISALIPVVFPLL